MIKLHHKVVLLLLILFSLLNLTKSRAQEIVDVEYIGGVSKILIELQLAQVGVFRSVDNDVDIYKVRYTTRDITGGVDTASGQMVLPTFRDKTMPILVYHHGTVGSRDEVPSNFTLANQNEGQISLIYASFGYATLAPDYIGLGDSPGFHPYVHAESEAWASIDMITAFKKYAETESIPLNDQLFTCGYSQGGHAAMATHKVLQRDFQDTYSVTASAPMSGPYNLYGSMVDFVLSDQEYDFLAYIAWVALSYEMIYPGLPSLDELDQFFKPEYVPDILQFRNEEIDLWELNSRLQTKLLVETGGMIAKFMLQDSIVEVISNDPDHPISLALKDNDVYDWIPEAPTRMYYCKADEQVSFTNATFTDSIMNANGATDVQALNLGDDRDHGGCVIPAIESSLDFFNSLKEITSPTQEVAIIDLATIFPNPVSSILYIANSTEEITTVRIYDLKGRLNALYDYPNGRIDLSSLQSGMYILQLRTNDKVATTKIILE